MNELVISLDTTDFVKNLMMKVDRYHFCTIKETCYVDRPSPLRTKYYDSKQTISAPHMHAKAIEYLEPVLKPGNSILDIGSGSGYLASLFGEAVQVYNSNEDIRGKVIGIEYVEELVQFSNEIIKKNLSHLMRYKKNFKILHKDGKKGHPTNSKKELYDGIHIGASCEYIPYHIFTQLKNGGILVIPLRVRDDNLIFCIVSKDLQGNIYIKEQMPVRYVPLI